MTILSMADLAEATRLTRAGRLEEAAALLRGAAARRDTDAQVDPRTWTVPPQAGRPRTPRLAPAGRVVADARAPGTFEEHVFRGPAGRRNYRLYVPARPATAPMPLLVMLHGCTQSAEDFAAGTRMNVLAEARGFLVAYPAQARSANPSRCWNWFRPEDQQRDAGEPALIAALTREIIHRHPVDAARVYVAGLSAGGAAAAVLGATHPDVFAAIGVHSGLARGAAGDAASAFAAMRSGGASWTANAGRGIPAIVFHGDADTTVHPRNGDQVVAQAAGPAALVAVSGSGMSEGGMRYTRTVHVDAAGQPQLEHWRLHGAGHAWAGGSDDGSYTDPRGPDASAEMVRFFLAQHDGTATRA